MNNNQKLEAISHILGTVFNAQKALRTLAPEFKWAGMGNLLGDYGELIAIEKYNLTKAIGSTDGYDAKTLDGKTVQVKANHSANMIGFRGLADLMLVLHIDSSGNYDEVYFGSFDKVLKNSSRSERDNKNTITIAKLKKLAQQGDAPETGSSE